MTIEGARQGLAVTVLVIVAAVMLNVFGPQVSYNASAEDKDKSLEATYEDWVELHKAQDKVWGRAKRAMERDDKELWVTAYGWFAAGKSATPHDCAIFADQFLKDYQKRFQK